MSLHADEFPCSVRLLGAQDALPQLRADLADATVLMAWLYLIDDSFFTNVFSEPLRRCDFFAVSDHRQKRTLETLTKIFPNFYPRTWAWNRTQHDKTLIIPNLDVVWLSTHNMTRGSWTLSTNRAARIKSPDATRKLKDVFLADYQRSKAVLPKAPPGETWTRSK